MKEVKQITVIGAGQMGSGIAQNAATAGYSVVLFDAIAGVADKSIARINGSIEKLAAKGKIDAAVAEKATKAIVSAPTLEEAVKNTDLVIEAALEKIELKQEIFKTLEQCAPKDAILASNTSSLSLTEIASATDCPERIIGMHFFNPVPVMKLLEIIKGYSTSPEAVEVAETVGKAMDKVTVVALDKAGFIVSRALDLMLNEAVFMLEEGVGSVEDIDNAMKFGCNHPMGPLELTDMIGLDVILAVMETMTRENGDNKYRPAPLLRKMVRAGKLGRKTGEGFYKYDK